MAFSTDFNNIISAAQQTASNYRYDADKQLINAVNKIERLDYTSPVWTDIVPATPPDPGDIPNVPIISPIELSLPTSPGSMPELRASTQLDIGQIPILTIQAPTLITPSRPSDIGSAPASPYVNTSIAFPDPPSFLYGLPAAPVFTTRTAPEKPSTSIPNFSAESPVGIEDAPTEALDDMRSNYIDTLLSSRANADAYVSEWMRAQNPAHEAQFARLESELDRFLNGGTGINEAVQDAIIARATEKQSRDAEAVRENAYNEAASRGFTLPSGALMSAVARARQEASNNVSKAITDLAVAQMEMEQKNLQFAISTSASLRTTMVSAALNYMGHIVSMNGQAMDYAKSVLSATVEMYNASVRVFSARVDFYRAQAAVYDAQLKAALASLDVYKSELDALRVLTDVDLAQVNVYKAQIDGVQALATVYRAQIEAVQGRANLEKLKLEIFQIETQAYNTQVQAKNAEWSAYNAQLSGEESKVRMYTAQLAGYNAQLDAYRAEIAAKVAESDAIVKENQAVSDNYRAQVATYTALVDAESKRAQSENENNRQVLQQFQAEVAAFELKTKTALAVYTATADANVRNATGSLSAQVEAAKGMLEYGATVSKVSTEAAKIYGDIANTAMSGINTLVAGNEDI